MEASCTNRTTRDNVVRNDVALGFDLGGRQGRKANRIGTLESQSITPSCASRVNKSLRLVRVSGCMGRKRASDWRERTWVAVGCVRACESNKGTGQNVHASKRLRLVDHRRLRLGSLGNARITCNNNSLVSENTLVRSSHQWPIQSNHSSVRRGVYSFNLSSV